MFGINQVVMRYCKMALLVIYLCCLFSDSLQTKKVNCRKYVYAPICRGVAAKRAAHHNLEHHKRLLDRRNAFSSDETFVKCSAANKIDSGSTSLKGVVEKLRQADGYPKKRIFSYK